MKAIPVALRERILQLYDQGKSTADIAASFGYCVAAVRRVRQHFQARGTLQPQTHRCGRKTLLTPARKARRQWMVRTHFSAPPLCGVNAALLVRRLGPEFGLNTGY